MGSNSKEFTCSLMALSIHDSDGNLASRVSVASSSLAVIWTRLRLIRTSWVARWLPFASRSEMPLKQIAMDGSQVLSSLYGMKVILIESVFRLATNVGAQ